MQIFHGIQAKHERADYKAADYAHKIRINGQKRHHQRKGKHPWEHKKIDRRNAQCLQGVDFLIDLHCADKRCIGRAYASAHHHADHHGAHNA